MACLIGPIAESSTSEHDVECRLPAIRAFSPRYTAPLTFHRTIGLVCRPLQYRLGSTAYVVLLRISSRRCQATNIVGLIDCHYSDIAYFKTVEEPPIGHDFMLYIC